MNTSKEIGGDQEDLRINLIKSHAGTKDCEQTDLDDGNYNFKENDIYKEGPVSYLGEGCVLQLTSKGLKLCFPPGSKRKGTKRQDLDISWQHVITAKANVCLAQDKVRKKFQLHYIEVCDRLLRARSIDLASVDEPADVWVDIIRDNCRKVPGRPRKMLVVVNTIGGMGNGADIYQKKVAPIFQLAQITTNVIYTERSQHARDIAENEDFSSFDCVVAVGGDGTVQEVLHGLTIHMQKSAGVDYNDVNAKFVCPNKPIGVIPAGSWNILSPAINKGVVDVETAALRILTGEIHKGLVYTYHSNGKLITVSGITLRYGTVNRMTKIATEMRWLKKYRYYCVMFYQLFQKKARMRLSLDYLPAPGQADNSPHGSPDGIDEEPSADLQWVRHDSRGKTYENVICSIPSFTDKEGHVLENPFTDHVNVTVDLGLPPIGLIKLILARMKRQTGDEDNGLIHYIDNVRGVRIKILPHNKEDDGECSNQASAATFQARPFEYLVLADGEIIELEVPEVEARLIPSFIPLYGTKSV